jgi:hypothetical protein
MQRKCRKSGVAFEIFEEDKKFYQKVSPVLAGQSHLIDLPTLARKERERRRFAFRNENKLYKRKCQMCGVSMVSIYSPDKKYKVFCQKCWWSDNWSALDYGRDFDFSRPFFAQFDELMRVVPRATVCNVSSNNSDYCNQAYNNKNCYLCSVLKDCEDSMYLSHCTTDRDCFDCVFTQDSELCYECIDCSKLYGSQFCQNCVNSANLTFCYACQGCRDCFGCVGLRNKQYYIFNKPYSKEEYEQKMAAINLGDREVLELLKKEFTQFKATQPHRAVNNINCENCSGDNLKNCKNSHFCFDSFDIEDCKFSSWVFRLRDCYDCYGIGDSELLYENIGVEELNTCAFNTLTSYSNNCYYTDFCLNSSYCFGSIAVKNNKYVFFNKVYSQQEYEKLVSRVIKHMRETGEWGEFFPIKLSPFAYNETIAQDYYPLTEKEAAERGYKWHQEEGMNYPFDDYQLPKDIKDVDESVCQRVLKCETSGRPYKITPGELKFYKQRGLPAPTMCSDERSRARMAIRNPQSLFDTNCSGCNKEVKTTFLHNEAKKVYCESCYLAL